MLYSSALTDTTVVRAVLLFYLAPLWSLALEVLLDGRRLRSTDLLSVLLGAVGMLAVFRGEVDLSGWRIGDGLAVGAGLCWAVGATLLSSASARVGPLLAIATASGALLGALLHLGLGETVHPTVQTLPVVLAAGSLHLAPVVGATLWSASRLRPTTMSYLLTAEIVTGIASATVLSGEPFGLPEALGSVAIVGAALVEVFSPGPTHPPGAARHADG